MPQHFHFEVTLDMNQVVEVMSYTQANVLLMSDLDSASSGKLMPTVPDKLADARESTLDPL